MKKLFYSAALLCMITTAWGGVDTVHLINDSFSNVDFKIKYGEGILCKDKTLRVNAGETKKVDPPVYFCIPHKIQFKKEDGRQWETRWSGPKFIIIERPDGSLIGEAVVPKKGEIVILWHPDTKNKKLIRVNASSPIEAVKKYHGLIQ